MSHASNGRPRLEALPYTRMHFAFEVEIPSDVRHIERVVGIITRQCEEMCFNPSQCRLNVPVALSEALSNAILRGNREHPDKRVAVRCDVTPQRVILEVRDEGGGFDMNRSMRDPTQPENLDREDGRGLFLMSRLMDEVEMFNSGGTVVRMTLRRHD